MVKVKIKIRRQYSILLNVMVDVQHGADGRRIPWIALRGWKNGVITGKNRFIDTEPVVKATKLNMRYVGKAIFKAAKEMSDADAQIDKSAIRRLNPAR